MFLCSSFQWVVRIITAGPHSFPFGFAKQNHNPSEKEHEHFSLAFPYSIREYTSSAFPDLSASHQAESMQWYSQEMRELACYEP